MLPIKRRVKKESFGKIMKDGVFVATSNFYLRFLNRGDNLLSRFAFVVPVKVKKTSAGRHLIKRKMTAVVEKALTQIPEGFSGIIFAKKDVSGSSYTEIEKEILELLKKVKILNRGQF